MPLYKNKFRQWDKINKTWLYTETYYTSLRSRLVGLKDIRGTDIYEYDIIQTYNNDGSVHSRYYIKYLQNHCRFNISQDLINKYRATVIGNIINNPELIPARYQNKIKELAL